PRARPAAARRIPSASSPYVSTRPLGPSISAGLWARRAACRRTYSVTVTSGIVTTGESLSMIIVAPRVFVSLPGLSCLWTRTLGTPTHDVKVQVYCRAKGLRVPLRIGVDIGGTFTDLVALDEATGVVVNAKALSTPSKLLDGVLRCADQAGVDLADCRLTIHGTTIGINALLEGKGARTALLTTEGFRDVLEIGRGNFLRMYDVLYRRP